MAKKPKKKTRKQKSTDWAVGQPLEFPKIKNPTEADRLAREIVEAELIATLKARKRKRTN